jgi:hypothetical protein
LRALWRFRPNGPGDAGAWRLLGQVREREQRSSGRVPGADHNRVPPGEPVTIGTEHVGQGMVDPVGRLALAAGGQPVGAEHVRRRPGAGGVDHRPRADLAVVFQP